VQLTTEDVAAGLAGLGDLASKLPAPLGLVGSIASIALGLAADLVRSGADATVELTRIREAHPLLNKTRAERDDWIAGMFPGADEKP